MFLSITFLWLNTRELSAENEVEDLFFSDGLPFS
jgi:hypothetical protein